MKIDLPPVVNPINPNQNVLINLKDSEYDVVVFSHIRWEYIHQRPQHVLSRLSQEMKVLYVEKPLMNARKGHTLLIKNPSLHILQPNINRVSELPEVLCDFINSGRPPIAWFYSPLFHGVLDKFRFKYVVYDCMEELNVFKPGNLELVQQEKCLLSKADAVFTNCKSIFENKLNIHDNVYYFPGSVDVDHFSPINRPQTIPRVIAVLQGPKIGYCGEIDEKLDFSLMEQTAAKLPHCSFVCIGPISCSVQHKLPKNPNIHFLGPISYSQQPDYVRAFDIAMMPFALNDSTRSISPSRILEYMASGKPIISTRLTDLERDYTRCIKLISGPEEFKSAIVQILEKKAPCKKYLYEAILRNKSWDSTVSNMKKILLEAVRV